MDKLTRVVRNNAVLLTLMVLVGVPRLFVGIWLGIVGLWAMTKTMLLNLERKNE
jgi:hypothetical protein